ncbi:hypothetical protein EOM39_00485 [Candidatus Gracilibacteria bacterium]|nr:hypothetical protein [Candidatus Gracilibacteria bacterium]
MLKKIILLSLLFFSLFSINYTFADSDYDTKVKVGSDTNTIENNRLDKLETEEFIKPSNTNTGANGIKDFIVKVAKDVKNIFYAIATIYFLVITIRLLISENSEESFEKYKKGLIWITIGIVVMQMAYAFVLSVFDKGVSTFAGSLINTVFIPVIRLLETFASIFFLLIAIYSFIRLLSANGEKEKIKQGIDAIIYATVGIFLVLLSSRIIIAIYGNYNISSSGLSYIDKEENFSSFITLFVKLINWMNGFVAIVTLIMIMYAGANIIFSGGDDEKMKKGRTTIIYAFIGILILTISYLILTFFIGPDGSKIT